VAQAVHVGRVEEVDAFVERVMDRRDRLFVIRVAVDARHRHEPEADGGDFERAASNLALFHGLPLFPFADGRKTWSVPDFQNKSKYSRCSQSLTSRDRKSTRLNSSHQIISYAVFCLKKKKQQINT